jgi:hypothetical protein
MGWGSKVWCVNRGATPFTAPAQPTHPTRPWTFWVRMISRLHKPTQPTKQQHTRGTTAAVGAAYHPWHTPTACSTRPWNMTARQRLQAHFCTSSKECQVRLHTTAGVLPVPSVWKDPAHTLCKECLQPCATQTEMGKCLPTPSTRQSKDLVGHAAPQGPALHPVAYSTCQVQHKPRKPTTHKPLAGSMP